MSSTSSGRQRYAAKFTEICIGNICSKTEPNVLLNHFQKFGNIIHYNFTSPTGGYVFITYENPSMVDKCMACKNHLLDGYLLYVKRALPVDDEHPRERFETTRDLMIVVDFDKSLCDRSEFYIELREYFSRYGALYACKLCHEKYFDYILVQFCEKDQVDRIILDKPHYYNNQPLDVMKYIPSNIEWTNKRYSSKKKPESTIAKDAIDDDNHTMTKTENGNDNSMKLEQISEIDLENEVYRLQNTLKKMNEEFALERKKLEDNCCEQLKKLNENAEKTQHLQQDLEKECSKLSNDHQALKDENDALNEQYLAAELENFEITSYYEQILAEEKAKTIQLEHEYEEKLTKLHKNNNNTFAPISPDSSKSQ